MKKVLLKKTALVFLALALLASSVALFISCGDTKLTGPLPQARNEQVPVVHRLSADPRRATQLECFYSLDPSGSGGSSKQSGGWLVSDWNYLSSDWNAYNWIKSKMGAYCSCWVTSSDDYSLRQFWGFQYKPVSFYGNPSAYGFYGGFGRGHQCRPYVRWILFRAGVYQGSWFPTYQDAINDYNGARAYTKPVSRARIGDIIQTNSVNGHSAIVVAILGGTEGQSVTSVDVVDANFVGDEVIGRHIISTDRGGLANLGSYIAIDLIALGGR